MKKIIIIITILLIPLISGCTNTNNNDYKISQKVVFICQHLNWAWGYSNNGYFIDNLGNVKQFDLASKKGDYLTNDKTFIKYLENLGSSNIIKKIASADVYRYYNMLKKVDKNVSVTKESHGADMGQTTFYGVIYNTNGSYEKIMIYATGDWSETNNDKYALQIKDWLLKINRK